MIVTLWDFKNKKFVRLYNVKTISLVRPNIINIDFLDNSSIDYTMKQYTLKFVHHSTIEFENNIDGD